MSDERRSGSPDFSKDARGLVPTIVQDARTGEVLMLAWQNAEALQATRASGEATFFSRSRQELWHKGSTSGNVQRIKAAALDCDSDAVLLQVEPAGPACHTGARSCFHEKLDGFIPTNAVLHGLVEVERTVAERRVSAPAGSYVAKLFADESRRHKKVGEEATELVVASLRGSREEIVAEAADLFFHALVLLRAHDLGIADVATELERRLGAPRRE